jgi:hypothetical protein
MRSRRLSRLCAAVALTGALLSGCRKSELETDGMIRSGWGLMIADGAEGGHPSVVYALAHQKLEDLIAASSLDPKTEVLLLPELSGYYIVVLAKHRVSESEKKIIDDLVNRAFRQAYEDVEKYKKQTNQASEPTAPSSRGSP